MRLGHRAAVIGALVGLLLPCAAMAQGKVASPHAATGTHKSKKAAPAPVPVATVVVELPPAPPPPPPTPGEMAPNPPNVSYEGGQLTITAENSTLSSILSAVGSATGANMDLPPGAASDRVWISLGPGPARAVLAALLVGTDLDYVIQASDEDQSRIQSVLLSPRNKGGRPGDAGSGSQTYAARIAERLRQHPGFTTQDSSDSDGSASASDVATDNGASNPTGPAAGSPTAQADTPPSPVSTSPSDTPNPALSARLPVSVSESDAHPAAIANTEQAIPQMQNLFELRKQLQAQENAKLKVMGSR